MAYFHLNIKSFCVIVLIDRFHSITSKWEGNADLPIPLLRKTLKGCVFRGKRDRKENKITNTCR